MRFRVARVAAIVTAGLGIATGLALVYAPLGTSCTVTAVPAAPGEPAVSSAPMRCTPSRLIDHQKEWWPLPGIALFVWSLAPLLAVAGIWSRRLWLVTLALVLETTVVISFGAGPLYVPLVLAPLALTWVLARRSMRAPTEA